MLNPKITNRYAELYRQYHVDHPKLLSGRFDADKIAVVRDLVQRFKATGTPFEPRILDYGSGKGYQYLGHRVHEHWGSVRVPVCYDPGVIQLAARPEGVFNIIICTDVLEHIEEDHVPDVLSDIFNYVDRGPATPNGVYLHVCCRPAGKSFADGVNLHATVRPAKWWRRMIESRRPSKVNVIATFEEPQGDAAGSGNLASDGGYALPGSPAQKREG